MTAGSARTEHGAVERPVHGSGRRRLPLFGGIQPQGGATMTPIELCKAIHQVMGYLPTDKQIELKRVYEKTWTLVVLYSEGLAKPTKAAQARLEDLWVV